MKIYALREIVSKKFLRPYAQSNGDAEFCNDCTITIEVDDSPCFWTTTDLMLANYVRNVSTGWYNSCYVAPSHEYKPSDLEIVELGSEEVIDCEDLPSDYEVITALGGYIYPWKVDDSKTMRSYSFNDYKKYLEIKK